MSNDMRIETDWLDISDDDPTERPTYAELSVNADGQCVTELETSSHEQLALA